MTYNKLKTMIKRLSICAIAFLFTFTSISTSYAETTNSNRYWINYAEIFYQIHLAQEEQKSTIYTVKKGDTLWDISMKYGIQVDALMEQNGLKGDIINVGQELEIPPSSSSKQKEGERTSAEEKDKQQQQKDAENQANIYKVRKGDTLWSISTTLDIEINEIISFNQLSSVTLQIGQELQIPSVTELKAKNTISIAEINQAEELSYAPYSQREYEWLARIIEAEAENQPYLGKVAVGSVVMNRVKDSWFPDTIEEVVKQRVNGVYQFTPVANGRIDRITPSEDSYRAALAAINGEDPTHGSLYFYNPDIATSRWIFSRPTATVIGDHTFAH